MRLFTIILIGLALLIFVTQFTLFVVQPIGAVPNGGTLVIVRLNTMKFIDSADAMCARTQEEGVSLLCRGVMMAGVARNATVLARLPYSRTLYRISTGGVEYGNPPGLDSTTTGN